MREFQLRSTPSILTTLKEPPKKVNKRKTKLQRFSYILIALLIIGYVAANAYMRLAIIQANAQIELYKQIINFPTDIEIEKLYISEGAKINIGDTLFKYSIPIDDQITTSEINSDKPVEWIIKERINTEKAIELKRIQQREIEDQLVQRRQMLATKKELILIGSQKDRNDYENLSIQINKLDAERTGFLEEISYLKQLLLTLNLEHRNYSTIETKKKEFIETKYYYTAQLEGIIGQINYNANEICYRKEELMTIHRNNDFKIKAFFNPEDMKYLHEGDVVNINYPDKTVTQGIITNFQIATYALPDEFQKKYEPTTRNIVAEVKLLNNAPKPLMSYYKMNVQISKNRYKL